MASATIDNTSPDRRNSPELQEKVSKNLLWLGIISIVMLFAGFTSAYVVSKADNFWVQINMPIAFWVSTAMILVSSVTMNMALSAARKNNKQGIKIFTTITFLLGIGFAVTQYVGWGQLVDSGNYMVGNIMKTDDQFQVAGEYGTDFTIYYKGEQLALEDGTFYFPNGKELTASQSARLLETRNTASSYLYILTVLHVLHLLGGLLYMISVLYGSYRERFDASNHLKIKLCGIYWHFLDGLWVYLFLFLLFIH